MDFSLWISTGSPWSDMLNSARALVEAGGCGIWVPDHFMPPTGGYGAAAAADPELGPVHEAWTTLAALAASVPRGRVGVMVSGNTYRHPALVAKMAATIDHISGGRAVVGLGAAWQENEHHRYGFEYGTVGERADRLEEAAAIIRSLLTRERTDFAGRYYRLDGAPLEPKPPHPVPLLIGGGGERRTLRTVARHADEWNAWGLPERMAAKGAILEAHCEAEGRDPGGIRRSAALFLRIAPDRATADDLRSTYGERGGLVGTITDLRQRVEEYALAGVSELVIAGFNQSPQEHAEALHRLRSEVLG
ncbi:MAG TPA: LLM class F420-dependent oxidoreductase [Actinobacteria bacterium]|nr:LLM class F420-dependent oxidoreductase [Actinomycetota bacterium]